MARKPHLAILTALALAGFTGSLWAQSVDLKNSPFKIPSPDTAEHPGAKDAPASSPATYPDPKGFAQRTNILIQGLATNDLQNWRKGYFTGGDPAKYTFGPIMAKLLINPNAPDAIAMQNDNRSYKEQYHFGCVNWSRFLPIFGSVLTPETQTNLANAVGKYGYLGQGGTENHKTMWLTSANVLPWYTKTGRLQNMGKDQALDKAKDSLRKLVKGLYAAGQGEWDSSTYLMFDVNGMMNVYDFSKDPECRLLAKAALDWYLTGYALKYTDGVYCAPNQRGFAHAPVEKIADNTGWLWWGSHKQLTPQDTRGFLWAMHAATSSYRPNEVITNIATRNLPTLPFESRDSKPNYWMGAGQEPRPSQYHESLFVSKAYTMGSLWNGFGGQTTRFEIVAASPTGGLAFTGATPIGRNDGNGSTQYDHFGDGNGMFDQSAQVGRAYLMVANIPDKDDPKMQENAYAFFAYPHGMKPAAVTGDWVVFAAGNAFIAVRPLAGKAVEATTPADKKGNTDPLIKFPGHKTGFIVETADTSMYHDVVAFGTALAKTKLDASKLASDLTIAYTSAEGKAITLKHTDAGKPEVTIDGQAVAYGDWPMYQNPYVYAKAGLLKVNDGKNGFEVDFTGDLPVYKPWTK